MQRLLRNWPIPTGTVGVAWRHECPVCLGNGDDPDTFKECPRCKGRCELPGKSSQKEENELRERWPDEATFRVNNPDEW